ncbi:MAG: hypothetical protein PW786_08450 [Arachidicoccus sp.]|nr:hypothetical protein [Arachidicoccus sp.]
MKFIKLIIISIIILFLLITCAGLLFPPNVTVMRSVNINAPEDSVYCMLSNMNNWQRWLFDSERSPKILSQNSKGLNAQAQVGKSKITITQVTDSSIESVWETGKIHNQICDFVLGKNVQSPGIQVTWYFRQHLRWYPWERIGAVLNEKILGPSMDSSFARLKREMEQ